MGDGRRHGKAGPGVGSRPPRRPGSLRAHGRASPAGRQGSPRVTRVTRRGRGRRPARCERSGTPAPPLSAAWMWRGRSRGHEVCVCVAGGGAVEAGLGPRRRRHAHRGACRASPRCTPRSRPWSRPWSRLGIRRKLSSVRCLSWSNGRRDPLFGRSRDHGRTRDHRRIRDHGRMGTSSGPARL